MATSASPAMDESRGGLGAGNSHSRLQRDASLEDAGEERPLLSMPLQSHSQPPPPAAASATIAATEAKYASARYGPLPPHPHHPSQGSIPPSYAAGPSSSHPPHPPPSHTGYMTNSWGTGRYGPDHASEGTRGTVEGSSPPPPHYGEHRGVSGPRGWNAQQHPPPPHMGYGMDQHHIPGRGSALPPQPDDWDHHNAYISSHPHQRAPAPHPSSHANSNASRRSGLNAPPAGSTAVSATVPSSHSSSISSSKRRMVMDEDLRRGASRHPPPPPGYEGSMDGHEGSHNRSDRWTPYGSSHASEGPPSSSYRGHPSNPSYSHPNYGPSHHPNSSYNNSSSYSTNSRHNRPPPHPSSFYGNHGPSLPPHTPTATTASALPTTAPIHTTTITSADVVAAPAKITPPGMTNMRNSGTSSSSSHHSQPYYRSSHHHPGPSPHHPNSLDLAAAMEYRSSHNGRIGSQQQQQRTSSSPIPPQYIPQQLHSYQQQQQQQPLLSSQPHPSMMMTMMDDDDLASSTGGSTRDKGRGSYKCGRCGVPKKGHVCPYQPKLKRRAEEAPPELRNAAIQVEMDEFMTLRRLNIKIQGLPESYASEPYLNDMVTGEPHPLMSSHFDATMSTMPTATPMTLSLMDYREFDTDGDANQLNLDVTNVPDHSRGIVGTAITSPRLGEPVVQSMSMQTHLSSSSSSSLPREPTNLATNDDTVQSALKVAAAEFTTGVVDAGQDPAAVLDGTDTIMVASVTATATATAIDAATSNPLENEMDAFRSGSEPRKAPGDKDDEKAEDQDSNEGTKVATEVNNDIDHDDEGEPAGNLEVAQATTAMSPSSPWPMNRLQGDDVGLGSSSSPHHEPLTPASTASTVGAHQSLSDDGSGVEGREAAHVAGDDGDHQFSIQRKDESFNGINIRSHESSPSSTPPLTCGEVENPAHVSAQEII